MFCPVVDASRALCAIQKSDINKRGDKSPRLASPVNGELDVLVGQAFQIAR